MGIGAEKVLIFTAMVLTTEVSQYVICDTVVSPL